MLWSALLPSPAHSPAPRTEAAQRALATWALQFTPRVALVDEAVLMEVQASVRLFGGKRALRDRVLGEGREVGVAQLAWAPNGLAALALARAGIENGFKRELDALLDTLPMATLSATHPHRLTLEHIGCRTLGDVRALPRGGMARRFDQHLLKALDQAYGLAPEVHEWVTLPEHFEERLELMARVEQAPALLFGARRLLLVLSGWLAARRAGVTAFTLKWAHDADARARARAARSPSARPLIARPRCIVRAAMAYTIWGCEPGPVYRGRSGAGQHAALHAAVSSPLPDAARHGLSHELGLVLERLSARLGPQRVLRPVLCEDHRPEWMCRWQLAALPLPRHGAPTTGLPQPAFLLPVPLRLLVREHRPLYQGELVLLLGPQRVEGGWWDRVGDEDRMRNVVRDYWVALSPQAGVVWVFQTRLDESACWFLHGHFA
ncbi:Y-family DNA polymerase [Hydrogenophaga sp.]|uniref:Y-family DNA polymerase n=1 Tax=Hydrogenophaga sp. TaxID=1904254 RepID=UPI003D2BE69B